MRQTINTPQGCKYRQIARFLHPSGAPLIDIYHAGAQRTLGAVAPPILLLTLRALPALDRRSFLLTNIGPNGDDVDAKKTYMRWKPYASECPKNTVLKVSTPRTQGEYGYA